MLIKSASRLGSCLIAIISVSLIAHNAADGNNFSIINIYSNNYHQLPDSLHEDSIETIEGLFDDTITAVEIYVTGDTVGYVIDGLDSIIYTQGDTSGFFIGSGNSESFYVGDADTSTYFTLLNDSLIEIEYADSTSYYVSNEAGAYLIPKGEEIAYPLYKLDTLIEGRTNSGVEIVEISINQNLNDILVSLGHTAKNVNPGLFGVHIGGMFDNLTTPNEVSSEYAWQWLVDLAPTTLRFPQGSGSKFMHLLHYADGSDVTGYGYDIIEIARYFDYIDGESPFDYTDLSASDINSIQTAVDPSWIPLEYREDFNAYHDKWENQNCEDVDTKFIDDFIALVQSIDAVDPGRPKTKVILDLNIISEPATECRAIADYLRAEGVNVVGIEMGNECYLEFFCDVLHFYSFEDYWQFINGTNLLGNDDILYNDPSPSVHTDMIEDHDFITAFKTASTSNNYNYKVGIVGMPLEEGFVFNSPQETLYGERVSCNDATIWNPAIYSKYGEHVGTSSKYKFDAVIMHTYYTSDHWRDIVFDNFNPVTSCTSSSDLWKYDIYDSRLQATFNGIIGIGDLPGNFKDFLVNGKDDGLGFASAIDRMSYYFKFTEAEPNPKDLWITEWNLKDNYRNGTKLEQTECEIYSNTFAHSFLFYQWWLKQLKVNFDPDYRENFLTYSTVQNYINGTSINLVSVADEQEEDYYSVAYGGADCLQRNYHVRRTTYFATYLLSPIFNEKLKYLRTSNTLPFFPNNSGNIQPTVFIDVTGQYLYIYYTNTKNSIQNYRIAQGTLKQLYPDATSISFDEEGTTNTYILAQQLYSSSGKVTLNKYDKDWEVGDPESEFQGLNACYENYDHEMEIMPTTESGNFPTIHNFGNYLQCSGGNYLTLHNCFTAQPYSIGYFKVHFTPMYPLKLNAANLSELVVYPNPANSKIRVAMTDINTAGVETAKIQIFNIQGEIVFVGLFENYNEYDISTLPSGLFQIIITDFYGNFLKSSFVKVE